MIADSPTTVSLVVTVLFLSLLGGAAYLSREKPGARIFVALQALSAVWAALTVVGLSLPAGRMRLRFWGLATGMSLVVIVFWLAFIIRYTGGRGWLTRRRFGIISLPLAVGGLLYALVPGWQPLVGSVTQETIPAGTVVSASIGPIGSVLGVYVYVMFGLGLAIVVRTIIRGNSLFVGQALALGLGTLVTVLASGLSIAGVPTEGYPTTQVALAGQTMFWGYALLGQEFLQRVPAVTAVGERAVFEDLEEGVLVVDGDGTVTRANDRARSYLDRDDVVGGQVGSLLEQIGVSDLSELPTRFESHRRTYRVKASPITDWRERRIGTALVIQDVTPILRRQQRLGVLNRILRHNVRNDMNIVLGMSNRLQAREDGQLEEIGNTLYQTADDLTSISDKAVEVDQVLEGPPSIEFVDLEAMFDRIVSPLAARHPEATVERRFSATGVHTDPRILSTVLEEALENALEHGGDTPHVTVDIERGDDGVRISVADDGPGIPQAEIDPIIAGEETSLQHASSLGLWMMHWGGRALGGEVRFKTTGEGSTVTVSVPDAEEADMAVQTGLGAPANGNSSTVESDDEVNVTMPEEGGEGMTAQKHPDSEMISD
jgi:signal transduction histidine kinase